MTVITQPKQLTSLTYSSVTNHIKVTATPIYAPEESSAQKRHFVWNYHIHIENLGNEQVQLLSRYWIIINSNGQVQEVKGSGVVGAQPILNPSEGFEYTSETSLTTPSGIMMGKYEMVITKDGKIMEIDIPAFSLDSPLSWERKN